MKLMKILACLAMSYLLLGLAACQKPKDIAKNAAEDKAQSAAKDAIKDAATEPSKDKTDK